MITFLIMAMMTIQLEASLVPAIGIERASIPSSDSLTVYVFLLDECVISQYYTPALTRLAESYKDEGVGFVGYFPKTSTSTEDIEGFGKAYHLSFPLLPDEGQKMTRRFEVTVTPEVAVWDHRADRLIYRGRIDDSYVRVGKRKLHPKSHDLEDIIRRWGDGEAQEECIVTPAIGCFISFD